MTREQALVEAARAVRAAERLAIRREHKRRMRETDKARPTLSQYEDKA